MWQLIFLTNVNRNSYKKFLFCKQIVNKTKINIKNQQKMVVPNSNPLETKLFKLMSDKDKLESQISTYGEILAQVRF